MYTLLAYIAQFVSHGSAANHEQGFAQQLMESADACAGHSPYEAQELRDAARAYLSVVR